MQKKLIKAALKALPPKTPEAGHRFLEAFYAQVPAEDLSLMDPAMMARTSENHRMLTKNRADGGPAIFLYNSAPGESFSAAGRTVIEIVSDDMVFLVDSVAAEITARHNRLIHLLVHPTLEGRKKGARISHMHIELQGALPEESLPALEQDIRQVITDVHYATRDWLSMRDKLQDCREALNNAPRKKYPAAEIDEYHRFLDYMYRDNFTLLGYRAYKFVEKAGHLKSQTIKGSSLGLLHDDVKPVYISESSDGLPMDLQKLRRSLPPVCVCKVNRKSTVHRAVPLDAVAIKQYDKTGKAVGEVLFIGLFTSVTYSRSIQDVPYIRRKAELVLNRSGFTPGSHDYKALRHVLEKYPRDELFQIEEDDMLKTGLSILRLQERHRIALYTRPDPFGRYISCLVYVPRDRFDTRLRKTIQDILQEELEGTCDTFHTNVDDLPLARVMYTVYVSQLNKKAYDFDRIEKRLQNAGKLWGEKLSESLREMGYGEEAVSPAVEKYGDAFPAGYCEAFTPRQAVCDIEKVETVLETGKLGLDLYKCEICEGPEIRLKIYHKDQPVTLSDILPILENTGLQIMSELPFEIRPAGEKSVVYIHDFMMKSPEGALIQIANSKDKFEEALSRIWYGEAEDDGLNRLILRASMDWRSITVLRACVRYLRQAQYPFSTRYIEHALTSHPVLSSHIVALFNALHNPRNHKTAEMEAMIHIAAIDTALEGVSSLDEDRILRSIVGVVRAVLRTNFYQTDNVGGPKSYLSLKLDSRKIPELPQPRPFREIYVYSVRMEGIHLRGDVIARGGIRWSDRHEDFRTEILGLMKAQQIKNSVIVPMGAKGGFIVKRPPREGGRAALMEEGIACYKTLIRGLLDITDNRKGTKVLPPPAVVRHDGDDPYLVVAADKGTATFSDIANGLSAEYGFWLGDAFASGGSAGYDHKKMGITARGAWESVKRHFRELSHNTQTDPFDVVGVGDMGGDVFGNGMLLSEKIRLVGAFNHLHIFCDPNPDPTASFKERKRLFDAIKGWDEYDLKKLSAGGRIYSRADKSLPLTPEIMARFDLKKDHIPPGELIQAMLRARADLLWFGGIGTYVKSSKETHADAGDKTNDSLRVNANEVRAHVIAEGANLAVTQLARIEYAQKGGRLNADFIDNSAGVDSSDHEVNIKILLTDVMADSKNGMTLEKRNRLLESMTDEVASLVLQHNYQQTQGISLTETQAAEHLTVHADWIRDLERYEGIDRVLEGLPGEEEIESRQRAGKGLTRPELAVLFSYAKITFAKDLLASDIPDLPETENWLVDYFPSPLRKKYETVIRRHRLRREIVATSLASTMVNRLGPTFVKECMEKTGAAPSDVARAYLIVRAAFDLETLGKQVEALDNLVPAAVQLAALRDISAMAGREVLWFLTRLGRELNVSEDIREFRTGISQLQATLDDVLTEQQTRFIKQRTDQGIADGLQPDLAHRIAMIPRLGAACDIIRISLECKTPIPLAARVYFAAGEHFPLHWLRKQARYIATDNRWTSEALDGLIDQLYSCQTGLATRILTDMKTEIKRASCGPSGQDIIACWIETHCHQAAHLDPLFAEMEKHGTVDLPMLIIAEQRIRNLYGG